MNKIENKIENINKEFSNRIIEINYMYSKLFKDISAIENDTENCELKPTDVYFTARAVTVFTYATFEKYVKKLTEFTLETILEHNYYNNNYVKELMEILKCGKDAKGLFELMMHNKSIYVNTEGFERAKDKGYFSRNGRIDAETVSYIIKVLNLNKNEPYIKLPKVTIDNIAKKRMDLAHGDYLEELSSFGPSRDDLEIRRIKGYIEYQLKLNSKTKDDIILFFEQFKDKNIEILNEIRLYEEVG
ncbi:MAG: hypothetical protein N4A64_12905 [Marinisporobacter sp.]|jgi:hypothetical protein|nr:hypothetical protein [Marinisporobacter sp.]